MGCSFAYDEIGSILSGPVARRRTMMLHSCFQRMKPYSVELNASRYKSGRAAQNQLVGPRIRIDGSPMDHGVSGFIHVVG
jgi:hypothetical protein